MELWVLFLKLNVNTKNNKNEQNNKNNNNNNNNKNKNKTKNNDNKNNKKNDKKDNKDNKNCTIGNTNTKKDIIQKNNNNIPKDDKYEDYRDSSDEDKDQQIVLTIADNPDLHMDVEQQIGNTCGPHSIVNAFSALGLYKPRVDMKKLDVDSIWLERQLAANNDPKNIQVIESRYLITNQDWWHVLIDYIVAMVYSSIDQIALIVNTTESQVPGDIGHWVVLYINIYKGHLDPVRIYDH